MDEMQKDYLFKVVYDPRFAPECVKRPSNFTVGEIYEVYAEDVDFKRLRCESPAMSHIMACIYKVKDDIGRVIDVPSCFFEKNFAPLTYTHNDHDCNEDQKLIRDYFDLRGTLKELIQEGEAQYTEDVTFHDLGIDPRRMSLSQAKKAWMEYSKLSGIRFPKPKNEFDSMKYSVKTLQHYCKTVTEKIEDVEKAVFGTQ